MKTAAKRVLSDWRFIALAAGVLSGGHSAYAAVFDGTGRVEVVDPSGALSWNPTANSMTVSCWFKLSVPTGVSLSKNMVILANARRSDATRAFAYLVQFNIATGNVEFTARGASALPTQTLVERPYLDRCYHVAVTRTGTEFTGYLDGRRQFNVFSDIGSSANTNGVFIGGTPDDSAHLHGEVLEVAIYQSPLPQDVIAGFMLAPQPVAHSTLGTLLRGYFKLGGTPNPGLANYAASPPAGTTPATKTATGVTFEETNQAGGQSTFDSRKNGGRDAITALGGWFSWEHTLFRQPTTGIPFEFKIGYNSGNAYNGLQIPQFSPFDLNGLGRAGSGWSHTLDARGIPSDKFQPPGLNPALGLLLWDGSLEVWDTAEEINYTTRHGEYRGELRIMARAGLGELHQRLAGLGI